ncbi:MAG: glutathione peroxidase [Proteobacteria bacterium]|nr:glutathione peroxidase [Pseudomonadota bacterium]
MLKKLFLFFALFQQTILAEGIAKAELPDVTVNDINGKPVNIRSYVGNVLLVANTASKCGFTYQYKDLETLHRQYTGKGFSVLGFPSNDFNQEAGSNDEIKNFCSSKFNVSFPLFEKNPVSGENKQPLFRFLTEQSDEKLKGEVSWNFEKFVIDKKGKVRARFGSYVNPMSKKIVSLIEELLSENP